MRRRLGGLLGLLLGGVGAFGVVVAAEAAAAVGREYLPETPYPRRLTFRGPEEGPPLRLVVMGDSTSTGVGTRRVEDTYPAVLARRLADSGRVELTVTGRSGARAEDVLSRQVPAALAARPDLVLMVIGSNDVTHLTSAGQFERTITGILDRLEGVPTVVGGIPEFGTVRAFAQPLRGLAGWRGHRLTSIIEAAVAARPGVGFVDLAAATGPFFGAEPERAFSSDGFHPGADGYAAWADALAPALEAADPRRAAPGPDARGQTVAPPRP